MSEEDKSQKNLLEIAEQVAEENSDKVSQLAQNLIKALDQESNAKLEHSRKSEREEAQRKSA